MFVATACELRTEAAKADLLIGSGAINPAYLDDPKFAKTLAEQFNSLSPENELKWSFTERQPGVFDFSKLMHRYDGKIDRWTSSRAWSLGAYPSPASVSKPTSSRCPRPGPSQTW
jgi:hypothetical protein